jgi:hypothetical protein
MNSKDYKKLTEAYLGVYNQSKTSDDLFDEVFQYLLGEGYTSKESIQIMIALAEQGAVQGSLFTKAGKTQKFASKTGKPLSPFIKTEPVPTRSRAQATPPRQNAATARSARTQGQLSIPGLNKPAAKPTPKPTAKPPTSSGTGGSRGSGSRPSTGLLGTRNVPTMRDLGAAPKPQWGPGAAKPAAKPASTTSAPRPVTKPAAKPTSAAKPASKPNPYRPGATVRATGPNMDKFPQLQRFANQARKVAEPASKVVGAVTALRNITPAGAAAAVMAPKPTGDATLKTALKRGTYKPQQGPANPDQGLTKSQSFDKKFKAAKQSGAKQFTWNNKTYNTKVK